MASKILTRLSILFWRKWLPSTLLLILIWPAPIQISNHYQVQMMHESTEKPAENRLTIQTKKKPLSGSNA